MDAYGEPIGGGTFYTGVKNEGDDGGLFSRLTGLFGGGANDLGEGAEPELSTGVAAPKGVYLYGGSGCGKSMMVDELLAPAIVAPPNAASTWVRRVHLSEFLLEVHQRAHRLRQETPSMGDPTPYLAYELICETQVLLLDEVAVTDVADALMIRKLFRRLFHSGMIIVCTSNRAPGELYLNGLQRASFLPFIADIEQRCHVHALGSSTDYRAIAYMSSGVAQLTSSGHGAYLQPLSSPTTHGMSAIWEEITKGAPAAPAQISLMGRSIDVPLACDATRTARFAFNDLCRQPLGPEDYLRLSRSYGAILVEGLITMVDAFYDAQVLLVMSADAPAEELFVPTGADAHADKFGDVIGNIVQDSGDESFAWKRTLSRLHEMASVSYCTPLLHRIHRKGKLSRL